MVSSAVIGIFLLPSGYLRVFLVFLVRGIEIAEFHGYDGAF